MEKKTTLKIPPHKLHFFSLPKSSLYDFGLQRYNFKKLLMKKMNLIILFCLFAIWIITPLNAQFYEDFNGENYLQSPKWQGDVHNFIINEDGKLQLHASQAGESSIYAKFDLPKDSIYVEFFLKMTFDPSDNNFTKIYLWADDLPMKAKNGYFLKLGENGNQDQIKLYKLDNGIIHFLGAGKIAGIAKEPVNIRVRLTMQQNGLWKMETDYSGNYYFREEIIIQDPNAYMPESGIFCIHMKYSSSRLEAFFVDDIIISKPEKDTIAPELLKVNVLDSVSLQLIFSEILNKEEANEIFNYTLMNSDEYPMSITFNEEYPFQVQLKFQKPFDGTIVQALECNNISDLKGNLGYSIITFFYAKNPANGEIVINEILSDPFEEKCDFIELYNTTENYLNLSSLYIYNITSENFTIIPKETFLPPKQFLAICKDTFMLKETYPIPEAARFCQLALPSFNISDAFVGISNSKEKIVCIDSVYYKKSWHHSLLLNTRGISIERINPLGPSNNSTNWHSASKSAGFATPGYANSVFQAPNQQYNKSFWLSSNNFTPVSDENLEMLKINYSMEKSGYLATVFVFDSDGGPVCTPVRNEILGMEGFLRWDGLNEQIQPVQTGIYVLLVNAFHENGDQFSARFSVAVIR